MRSNTGLMGLYKECARQINQKIHPSVVSALRYNDALELDMDCLANRQELAMFRFVAKAKDL